MFLAPRAKAEVIDKEYTVLNVSKSRTSSIHGIAPLPFGESEAPWKKYKYLNDQTKAGKRPFFLAGD